MQIIVPMSGFGERFRRAGYDVPKPLIEVEGKPIIAHVIDLFPGETRFVFICNQDHLDTPSYRMREVLKHYCPTGQIVPIAPHKLGPVNAVIQARDYIDPATPTIVNYCDFTCVWDYPAFKQFVLKTECDGAIPCYRGFHPHMLGSVNYAYVRQTNGWVDDIQEKKPWTARPMEEYASSGTYYFRTGTHALDACAKSMQRPELALNGEYYASLAYKPMLDERKKVAVFEIEHFMQWGTPEDLCEYNATSRIFRKLAESRQIPPRQSGAVMIPMAGAGSRFAAAGYKQPKPLIPVSGRMMAAQATRDMPDAPRYVFIVRQDLPDVSLISNAMMEEFPTASVVVLDQLTDGQARTCLLATETLDLDAPLTIGACDNGVLYNSEALEALLADQTCDVVIWGVASHFGAARSPGMYGWIDADAGQVKRVSVKTPLADPRVDPIVIGAFTFRRARDFVASAERMISRDGRVNGEFYVDTCVNDAIALGLNVRLFEADAYLCWGTPDELRTFQYWQACFHKWPSHPYRLEKDADIPAGALKDMLDALTPR